MHRPVLIVAAACTAGGDPALSTSWSTSARRRFRPDKSMIRVCSDAVLCRSRPMGRVLADAAVEGGVWGRGAGLAD